MFQQPPIYIPRLLQSTEVQDDSFSSVVVPSNFLIQDAQGMNIPYRTLQTLSLYLLDLDQWGNGVLFSA